ncbi:hypothetical protein [Marinobacter sp. SS21]|uniref:hypothetical protein n=1 Tax=Marinobacter sp. SS21 TaxID=2979460 RepID=UPI00232CC8AA|nr:hypothetical protein [Marinobacter sp. SS21]MDC0664282.1 hypothetical protein [Marinobacter sp. SS21]
MSHRRLLDTESHWLTNRGKAFLTERVVMHGRDLHKQLGNYEWLHLYLFSILGRDPGEQVYRLLNYYYVATSFPDPSIWPNHVTALAGSVRTTPSLALMAGLSISEASIYGRRPEVRALDFFYRAGRWCDEGKSLTEFVELEKSQGRIIYGYGRPLASADERISHTLEKAKEWGFSDGRFLNMALDVYEYLRTTYGYSMNIAAIDAALAADVGLNAEEYQLFMTPIFLAGMTPCFLDAAEKPEGAFFPMRCTSICYGGPAKREWSDNKEETPS